MLIKVSISHCRYLLSVLDGNVYVLFPYISDTGALPPESCVFGLLVNIGAALRKLFYLSILLLFTSFSAGLRYYEPRVLSLLIPG